MFAPESRLQEMCALLRDRIFRLEPVLLECFEDVPHRVDVDVRHGVSLAASPSAENRVNPVVNLANLTSHLPFFPPAFAANCSLLRNSITVTYTAEE